MPGVTVGRILARAHQNTPSPDGETGGIKIPISGQLFQAVMSECMADEGLWIDQVCIDQSNQAEKNISIPAMAALYKHARRVLVVVENIEVDEAEQQFLRNFIPEFESSAGGTIFSRPHFGEVPAYMEKHRIFREFFNKICTLGGSREPSVPTRCALVRGTNF